MSEQFSPDHYTANRSEVANRRKARRDRAAKPVPENYAAGDIIIVENKGRDGFLVHALAAVVDVLDFAPLRQWRSPFNLIVRIMLVNNDTFEPCVTHLVPVNTELDTNYYFDRGWRLSRMSMDEFAASRKARTITINHRQEGDAIG